LGYQSASDGCNILRVVTHDVRGGAHVNRYYVLAARPAGAPKESDFRLEEGPIPRPGSGEVLVRNIYMIEHTPRAFLGLFARDNVGKMVVKLGPDPALASK
jgi:NADPH-dependent curcumin reductase CurA